MNPGTGEIITMYNPETQQEDPVYRHTELVGGVANHTFMKEAVPFTINTGSGPINLDSIAGK